MGKITKYLNELTKKKKIILVVFITLFMLPIVLLLLIASPAIFFVATIVFTILSLVRKNNKRKMRTFAITSILLTIISIVAIDAIFGDAYEETTAKQPIVNAQNVVESQDVSVNQKEENKFHENDVINQTLLNFDEKYNLNLKEEDVKKGAYDFKASVLIDDVNVNLSDNNSLFIQFDQETSENNKNIIEVFLKFFTAIKVDIDNEGFNTIIEEISSGEYKNYSPFELKGAKFTFESTKLDNGEFRYSLESEFPQEMLFKKEHSYSIEETEVLKQEIELIQEDTVLHFIDTGNSDSILIQNSGKFALIDGGDRDDDALVSDYLLQNGVTELEYLVITHYHADHLGAADSVVNNFDVKTTLVPNGSADTQVYKDFINSLANKGLSASVPLEKTVMPLGTASLTFYNTYGGNSNENDNSLVTLINSGNRKALLTGDAESSVEASLTDIGDVDVFKAGHHGSSTSNSSILLDSITPEHIIVTVGANNKYGHPSNEVMSRFKDRNIPVYRNDEQGTIVVTLAASSVTVDKEPGSYNAGSGSDEKTDTTQPSETSPQIEVPAESNPVVENFANCTELKKVYPSGVASDHPAYKSKMDRDKDGWACE